MESLIAEPEQMPNPPPSAYAGPTALPEGRGLTLPVSLALALPLSGLTVLTAEDSRFASDTLRLLCQRSGAKLRRTETMEAARRHLRVYRPDILIIDLGLPDGDGADLIAELSQGSGFAGLLLATSADPEGRDRALAAGAAGFLEKPLESLAGFQNAVQHWLIGSVCTPALPGAAALLPDPQALRDDLIRAAELLAQAGKADRSYVARFIQGLARSSRDAGLARAAALAVSDERECAALECLVKDRLCRNTAVFAGPAQANDG